ncbi:MAG: type II toxin-antitoxin system RatA family toxin [Magnetospirillum sp. WYHS-4]
MTRLVHRDLPGYTPERIFALAIDVEAYPRFLFWCESAAIRRREGNRLEVDNVFAIGPLRMRFRTDAVLDPPRSIEVTSTDPPFSRLRLVWTFEPLGEGGCRVSLSLDQAFRSLLFEAAASPFTAGLEEAVIDAFVRRARDLYGQSSSVER